jgi:hypothetical protein
MKKLIFLLLTLALILALVPGGMTQAKKPAPSLRCTTEYDFVGHLGIVVDGRLLAWEGTISGDINGVIQYWMPPGTNTGQVGHWVSRWEIWDGGVLLLAGDEAGTTTVRHGKNSVWRANGIVTEASEEFEDWIGRQVHDGGHFTWVIPGVLPDYGWGIFRIN